MMAAAVIAEAGMDPMRFLESKDPFEIEVMQRIAEHVLEIRDRMQQNLANRISNAVWSAVKK